MAKSPPAARASSVVGPGATLTCQTSLTYQLEISYTFADTGPVPELHFTYDESIERGVRLSRLIDEAMQPAAVEPKRRARRTPPK